MTIEERMEFLERTIRRWRRIACTMAVLVVAGVGIGAAQMNEDELRLRKLVIEDDKGGDRIVLDGVADILTSRIHLRDEKGRDRIVLSASSIEATIVQLDAKGNPRVRSSTLNHGTARIIHSDANGKTRISSGTFTDGLAGTTWLEYDANGKRQPVKILP